MFRDTSHFSKKNACMLNVFIKTMHCIDLFHLYFSIAL